MPSTALFFLINQFKKLQIKNDLNSARSEQVLLCFMYEHGHASDLSTSLISISDSEECMGDGGGDRGRSDGRPS